MASVYALNDSDLSTLRSVNSDQLGPTRWNKGSTTSTNEARLDLFKPYLTRQTGGIFIGIGGTQNYTLAAWATVDFAYIVDFTEIVVNANWVHIALFKQLKTKERYLRLWQKQNDREAVSLLKRHYKGRGDVISLVDAYRKARPYFKHNTTAMRKVTKRFGFQVYYTSNELYAKVRKMALEDRFLPLGADLNGKVAFRSIAKAANMTGAKVRILYLSNTEGYKVFWPYQPSFIQNVQGLPATEDAFVLRTIMLFKKVHPWADGSEILSKVGFHYNAQPLEHFQKWLSQPKLDVSAMLDKATTEKKGGFSFAGGLPGD